MPGIFVDVERLQLLRRSKSATVHHPVPHFDVGLLKIVVDNNPVVGTRLLRVLELILGLRQALVQTILSLCTAAAQSTLQLFEGRGCQEKEASVEIAELDLLHTLQKISQYLDSQVDVNTSIATHTSISISRTQIRPCSATVFTACLLVP